jgi:DNA-binding CsgD family transcriptional regulator
MAARRLLSGAAATSSLPGLMAEHNLRADSGPAAPPRLDGLPAVSSATWDAALVQAHLAESHSGLGPSATVASPIADATAPASDPASFSSGLTQLDRYLSRAWYRAGIPVQMHEDCSQAVFTTLLQRLGRQQFDGLIGEVGHLGIKDVFSRETDEGADFFRAVDMVKKRAQRQRVFLPIDAVDVPASPSHSDTQTWHEALRETIDQSLSPREAGLINETLMGKTPAEIALHSGVTPKTISNEKTRVVQKLRVLLLAQDVD